MATGSPQEQAQELLSLSERESLKGKPDYAILALLLGGGRQRKELVSEVLVWWPVCAGEEIVIEKGASLAVVLRVAAERPQWRLSESLREAGEHGSAGHAGRRLRPREI